MAQPENSKTARNPNDEFGGEEWDPMLDDYESKFFNTYNDPMRDMERGIAVNPHEKFSPVRDRQISPTKGDSDVVTLFVSNIPSHLTKDGLTNLFKRAGDVVAARVFRSKTSEQQFGFVEFRTAREAEDAIKQLHGWEIVAGGTLNVRLSNKSENSNQYHNNGQSARIPSPNLHNPSAQRDSIEPRTPSPTPVPQKHPSIVPSSTQSPETGKCSYCGEAGRLKRCGSCKKQYCGVACQRQDWPKHRNECSYKPKSKPEEPKQNGVNGLLGSKHLDIDEFENRFEIEIDDAQTSMKDIFGIDLKDENIEVTYVENGKIEELPDDVVVPNKSPQSNGVTTANVTSESATKVLVGSVCATGVFYANVIKEDNSTELLLEITTKLSADGRGRRLNVLSRFDCREGCKIATEYEGEWSRAKIVHVDDKKRNEAEILYVDYGNTEIRPLSDLFILPEYATKLKPQAEKFVLQDFPNANTDTEKEALVRISEEVLLDQILRLESYANGEDKKCVRLFTDSGENCSVAICKKFKNANIEPERKEVVEIKSSPNIQTTAAKPIYISKLSSKVPVENLPKDCQTINVVLLHVVSPQLIQFQIVTGKGENIMETTEIMNEMRLAYENTTNDNFRPSTGELCVGLFDEDQSWYRVSLLSYSDDTDDIAHVRYVDYGNTSHVSVKNLRPIEERFTELNRQARPCCLVREKTSATISEQCVKFLSGHSLSEIHKVEIIDNRFGKVRFQFTDERMRSIMDKILSGKGDTVDFDEKAPTADAPIPTNADMQPTQPRSSTTTNSLPEAATHCKSSAPTTPCDHHIAIKPSHSATNPTIAGPKFPSDQFPTLITHSDSPSNFYGQFAEKSVIELWMNLSRILSSKAETNLLDESESLINDGYYAAHCSDGEWYRAQLMTHTQASVTVRYVDFGNTETLPRSNVRRLDAVDARVPALALPMKLADVEPKSNTQWSDDACAKFTTLIVNNVCEAKVTVKSEGSGKPALVELRLGNGVESTVSDELIKFGLAQLKSKATEQQDYESKMSCKTFLQRSNLTLVPGTNVSLRIGENANPELFYCKLVDASSKSFPCTLHGVKPNTSDGKWTNDAKDIFTKSIATENGQITAVVIAITDFSVMLSPLLVKNPIERINDVLVRSGHAQYML